MVLGHGAPIAAVEGAGAVVAVYPVVVEFKGVAADGDLVAEDVVAFGFQGGLLKDLDQTLVEVQVFRC